MERKPLEKEIQNDICEYLSLKRVFFWRQNTAPTVNKSSDGWHFRKMPKYAMRGIPDIIAIRPGGKVLFLEVKRPGGKLSHDQEAFRDACRALGAEYHTVFGLDDVIGLV